MFHQGDGNTRLRWLAVILCLVATLLGISLILHMRSDPRLRWAALVSRTSLLELGHPEDRLYPHGASFARFKRNRDTWVFTALASARRVETAPRRPADYKLVLIQGVDQGLTTCDYEPNSGRFKYDGVWLELPASLQRRMSESIARGPESEVRVQLKAPLRR